jgi:hypothetical protein
LKVTPGDPITIEGTLVDIDGKGIDGKTMKLAGTAIENLPAESTTSSTDPEGKFTFTIPRKVFVPVGERPVTFKASFTAEPPYVGTSNSVTYQPTGGIPTTIELSPISNVNPGDSLSIQGTLKTKSDGTGVDGKTITLTKRPTQTAGPVESNVASVPTDTTITLGDGTFIFADVEPLDEGLWEIQALFSGDSNYGSSVDIEIYNTTAGTARLKVQDVVLQDSANQVETKIPIPGPSDFSPCKFVSGPQVRGDKYNEIQHKGTDLIYKAKQKGKSKTFEYSMFYDCPNSGPGPGPGPNPPQGSVPGAPEIKSPRPGTVKTAISQITGNAETGTTVEVFDGSKSLGTAPTKTDPDGNWWSLGTQLGDGTYSLTAKATNAAGKTGPPSTVVNVVVDTGPGAPVITSPKDGDKLPGISEIDGTAEPSSKVEVFKNGTLLGTIATGNDGKWALTLNPVLGTGGYIFTARATDALGKTGPLSQSVLVSVEEIVLL